MRISDPRQSPARDTRSLTGDYDVVEGESDAAAEQGDGRLCGEATRSPVTSEPRSDAVRPSTGRRLPGGLPARSHGLAPYVASSAHLRRLVALGVDVSGWDRRPGVAQLALRLDWERDMAPRIQLLHDAGVPADRLAALITRNPLIFKERIDDLQASTDKIKEKYLAERHLSNT